MCPIRKVTDIDPDFCAQHLQAALTNSSDRVQALDRFLVRMQRFLDSLIEPGNRPIMILHGVQEFPQQEAMVLTQAPIQRLHQRCSLLEHVCQGQIGQLLGIGFSLDQCMENQSAGFPLQIGND